MAEYIEREAALEECDWYANEFCECEYAIMPLKGALENLPAADVRPVSRLKKIIESLQEQADIYNARAKELLIEEDGQVSQYTWAVSLRETYRRIIKTLDDLIS